MVHNNLISLFQDFHELSSSLKPEDNYQTRIAEFLEFLNKINRIIPQFIITGEYIEIGPESLHQLISKIKEEKDFFILSIFKIESKLNEEPEEEFEITSSYDITNSLQQILSIMEKLNVIVAYHKDESALIFLDPTYKTPLRPVYQNPDSFLIIRSFYELEQIDYFITFLKRNPNEYLNSLIRIVERLDKKTDIDVKILNLGITKALYLINKILIAKNVDNVKIFVNKEHVNLREYEKNYSSASFNDFIEIIKLNCREKLDITDKEKIERLIQKYSSKKSLVNFLRIKILKDFDESIINVEEFINRINLAVVLFNDELAQISKQSNSFDQSAQRINITFIANNIISMCDELISRVNELNLEIKDDQLSKITSTVMFIKDSLKDDPVTGLIRQNYFTQYKYLCFLCEKARFDIKNNNFLESKEKIKRNLTDVLNILVKSFYQMEVFQKYQLRLQDSFIEKDGGKTFIYSSINLPLNFKHEENRIVKLRFETYEIINLIEQLDAKAELQKEQGLAKVELQRIETSLKQAVMAYEEKLKETTEKTEKQIGSVGKKSTEILAIFAAIVLFTSGSIQLFSNVPNLHSAIYIMFCFSFSIVSVFSLIHFSLSMKEGDGFKSAMQRHFGLLIITAIIMAILFAISWFLKIEFTEQKRKTNKIVQRREAAVINLDNIEKKKLEPKNQNKSAERKN